MESTNDLPTGERTRDVSARLWSARGFFWGLASIGLAFMGQQIAAKRGNKPYGDMEWQMYMRLADQLDPSFRT